MTKQPDALELFSQLITLNEQHPEHAIAHLGDINPITLEELHTLIAAHHKNKQQTWFGEAIASQVNLLNECCELSGQQIGHFTLQHKLGEGGMGAVYKAQRHDDKIQQDVAIKLINPAITALYGDKEVLREAQFLATLNHAYIAKVLDVGECELGAYIIMEYIEGDTLLAYCEQHKLSYKARLELFNKICDAVSYAHQNRVIHADLKPSNILVNNQGEPKLVDFGIARAVNNEQTKTIENEYIKALSQEYASPEQLAGHPLSTKSDVYSLGKILKHLINGSAEFELQLILEKCTHLIGDERYDSPKVLALDLDNWLNSRPINANSNQTYLYKASKWIKRNSLTSLFIFIILVCLIGFTSAIMVQNSNLNKENLKTKRVVTFLNEVFMHVTPIEMHGNAFTAEDIASMGYERVVKLDDNLEEKFDLMHMFAGMYYRLGNYQKAIEIELIALELAKKSYTNQSEEYFTALSDLGLFNHHAGHRAAALQYFTQAYELSITLYGISHYETLYLKNKLAVEYVYLQEYNKADVIYTSLVPQAVADKDMRTIMKANIVFSHADLKRKMGMIKEAYQLYTLSAEIILGDPNAPQGHVSSRYMSLHQLNMEMNNLPLAKSFLEKTEYFYNELFTEFHPRMAKLYSTQITFHSRMNNFNKAKEITKKLEELYKINYKPESEKYQSGLLSLAIAYYEQGDESQCLEKSETLLNLAESKEGKINEIAYIYNTVAKCFELAKNYKQAIFYLEKANVINLANKQEFKIEITKLSIAANLFKLEDYSKSYHIFKTVDSSLFKELPDKSDIWVKYFELQTKLQEKENS